ncbi:thioredoxin family protein [Vannielia litorea]|uniref:thioredoxin family protein n=1 Tax=Vannielia litorea TaxID=1217970 RepID=UPI001C950788|nr:thioredoxin family protein [Vannielia litorea]MBY6153728.1 thioredoxin family protein [Vannielia litorea]
MPQPPAADLGTPAPDFTLPGTDGKTWSLADVAGEKGMLLIFMCNHCPYVKGIIDRLIVDAQTLQTAGIGVAAICANDADSHPADSFENMKAWAEEKAFPFPYLHDESQEVARAYDAVCTPDFFGYNAAGELQYRGRLDAFGKNDAPADAPRELVEAMMQVAATGRGPDEQVPSMGCSIKWKAA